MAKTDKHPWCEHFELQESLVPGRYHYWFVVPSNSHKQDYDCFRADDWKICPVCLTQRPKERGKHENRARE